MLIPLWWRYLLRRFLAIFLLFLICFYGLYILIDYASQASSASPAYRQRESTEVCAYYLMIFINRAELLLPIALLIACVHTLCTLNTHRELLAFRAGGLSLLGLLSPFIFVGIMCTFLQYASAEWLIPIVNSQLKHLDHVARQHRHRNTSTRSTHPLVLLDGSLLLFGEHDIEASQFHDVYWIRSVDDIYRLHTLSLTSTHPVGQGVIHFIRQPNGYLSEIERAHTLPLPMLHIEAISLPSRAFDADCLPLSTLFDLAENSSPFDTSLSEKEAQIQVALWWKLLIPWLCFIAIVMPSPLCVRFSRTLSLFLIYAVTLFTLIALYLFLDAAQLLATHHLLSPFQALILPCLTVFAYFSYRFTRIEKS